MTDFMNDSTTDSMTDSMTPGYAMPARALHWLMAAGFVFMWACGYAMTSLPSLIEDDSPFEELLYMLHISTGVTLFALLIARVAVRRVYPPPPPVAGLSRFEVRASHAAHILLYVLPAMIITVGWVEVDFGGHAPPFYGLGELPMLLPEVEYIAGFEVEEVLETAHRWLAYGMLCLALAHAGAVVKHRWIDRNDVFHRMSLGRRK